jgi:hypothetical protein
MGRLVETKTFQSVICLKDNKAYVYDVDENPCFLEDDYAVIKCFPVKSNGKPDLSREIGIYGKYLISA